MTATSETTSGNPPLIRSLIPARIDRLPWSKFHTRLVMALGVAWILDGLEITIASNVGADLTQIGSPAGPTLATDPQVSALAACLGRQGDRLCPAADERFDQEGTDAIDAQRRQRDFGASGEHA